MSLFETDEQLKSALLKAAKSSPEGATANFLAKSVGFAKATNRVKRALDEMVGSGQLATTVNDKGYDSYVPVAGASTSTAAPAEKSRAAAPEHAGYTLPEQSYGYNIESATDGRFAYNVHMPDGKELALTKSERLLVINQDPNYRFIVEEPEDILTAIGTFTKEAGYAHFLVKDMASGKHIKTPSDLGTDVALFVGIERHNKAGWPSTENTLRKAIRRII